MRLPPMRLLKLTLFAAFIVCEAFAQTPALQYDFFPLAKGLTWRYDYYSEMELRELRYNVSIIDTTQIYVDSGIVCFKITDSLAYNDSTIAWLIEEFDSLKVRRFKTYYPPQDTLYWRVTTFVDTLFEETTGMHELTGIYNDHVRIWDFKSASWKPSFFRYSYLNNDQSFVAKYNYTASGSYADTLFYHKNIGLVGINGFGSGLHLTYSGTFEKSIKKVALQNSAITSVHNIPSYAPLAYVVYPNYPNPFNPATSISFSVPTSSHIQLKIFDYLGREIATLVDEEKQPGAYTVRWDASGYSSGIYVCRLYAGSFIGTQKMLLLK